jgi:nucleotide-binding universal stress UspA family protein
MHVLLGVDGTERSLEAARFAGRLLDPEKDQATLYFSSGSGKGDNKSGTVLALTAEIKSSLAASIFRRAMESWPEALRKTSRLVQGSDRPEVGILTTADDEKSELIVVGADSSPKRFMIYLGGVARKLAQKANCPVLIFRPTEYAVDPHKVRVLVADDGSESATHAIHVLQKLHFPAGSEGWICRVVESVDLAGIAPDVYLGGFDPGWHQEYMEKLSVAKAQTSDELKARQALLPAFFHANPGVVRYGHRVQEICDVIAEKKIDLLVMGARNLNAVERFLGSTSEGLLRYAPCSTLVVRQPHTVS